MSLKEAVVEKMQQWVAANAKKLELQEECPEWARPHEVGMPEIAIPLGHSRGGIDVLFRSVLTPTYAGTFYLESPFMHSEWKLVESAPYENEDQLLAAVEKTITKRYGMWAESPQQEPTPSTGKRKVASR